MKSYFKHSVLALYGGLFVAVIIAGGSVGGLSGCASIAVPKPITIVCTKLSKVEFVEKTAVILKNYGYSVVKQDAENGEIKGFRQERQTDFGEHVILTGPYTLQAKFDAGTVIVLIFTVRDDGKTPVKSWDEAATDGFEKANYMGVMAAIREICAAK
jgi:hypothetical protein